MTGVRCAITLLVLLAAPVLSSPNVPSYSNGESGQLLLYARTCLLARLDGATSPAPPEVALKSQRACFVTFFTGKRVIACFGGFSPRKSTLAEEIDDNIRLALKNDLRARRMERHVAARADVQITFPGQPRPVSAVTAIDPAREGIFVEADGAGIAFVPGEARTSVWALKEALRRLGVLTPTKVAISRFSAELISSRNGSVSP